MTVKTLDKKLIGYAVAAFLIGIPLQIFVDWASNNDINETPIWAYILGALLFSALMTLFKYFNDKRKAD